MKNFSSRLGLSSALAIASMLLASCADTGGPTQPRRQITECPVGLMLVCESRQQREPSRGGADEEIPLYDSCRCVPG